MPTPHRCAVPGPNLTGWREGYDCREKEEQLWIPSSQGRRHTYQRSSQLQVRKLFQPSNLSNQTPPPRWGAKCCKILKGGSSIWEAWCTLQYQGEQVFAKGAGTVTMGYGGQILLWPPTRPFPLTLLNDFMVFSSVNDLVIHCWAPLSWSSPLISTKLISSLPRFLLPCSRLNWKRGKKFRSGGVWVGGQEMSPRIQSLWNGFGPPQFHCTLNSLYAVCPFTVPPTKWP